MTAKIKVERVNSRTYYRTKTKPKEHVPIYRDGVTCQENCKRYPCFWGIENLETNFAQTCQEFSKRGGEE